MQVHVKNWENANLRRSSVRQSDWQVAWRIEENRYTRWVARGIAASNLSGANSFDYLPLYTATDFPMLSRDSKQKRLAVRRVSRRRRGSLKILRDLEEPSRASLKIFRPRVFIPRTKIDFFDRFPDQLSISALNWFSRSFDILLLAGTKPRVASLSI